jgi:rubrerythrin
MSAPVPESACAAWCLPQSLTHLYYSPIYPTLTDRQQRIYNRLHACYLCELFVFFEEVFPGYYTRAAAQRAIREPLRSQLLGLVRAERRHALMFRSLARQLAPDLYGAFRFRFVALPRLVDLALRILFRFPAHFSVILWVTLIQEERALYYAREVLRSSHRIDDAMVRVQSRHLSDEQGHLDIEEALLRRYWDGSSPALRRLNVSLMRWAMKELLTAPKRGGMRLIDRYLRECPELQVRAGELRAAMRALDGEAAFHRSLYSRQILPRTFALFDRYPEFRTLQDVIPFYAAEREA